MFEYTTISPVSMPTYDGIMVGGVSYGSTTTSSGTNGNQSGNSDNGATWDAGNGGGATTVTRKTYSITGTTEESLTSGTASSSAKTLYSPPTISYVVPSQSGPPTVDSYGVTETVHVTFSSSTNRSGTTSKVTHSENTYYGYSGSYGNESDYTTSSTYNGSVDGDVTDGTLTTSSFPESSSSTARTASGTSSAAFRDTYTYGYADMTGASSVEDCPRISTSSWEYNIEGADPPATSSTWDTVTTMVGALHTTAGVDTDSPLTVEGDYTSAQTENFTDGTYEGTRVASSFAKTTSIFHCLEDTVCRLSDGGSDFLLGYMLWSMKSTNPATSYAGKFTDLYEGSTGNSFTISDYQRFSTNSLPIPVMSLSRDTYVSVSGTSSDTITVTKTNGHYPYTTDGWTNTSSLGDVGTSESLPTGTHTGTTTRFTHTDFVSGYATSGNLPFTTGTTAGFWDKTSETGTKTPWESSYTTTVTRASRVVTDDVVLRSVATVTSVSGTNSYHSWLGLSRVTTSRVIRKTITVTDTRWGGGISYDNWSSQAVNVDSDGTAAATYFTSRTGGHGLTYSLSVRLLPKTYENMYGAHAENEAWATTPARGWAGFCGSFTQANPAIYLTTTSGLAAGSTFTDAFPAIYLGTKALNEDGVKIVPCHESTGITLGGIGLVKSSLISSPTAITSVISIAATWTSTTATGTSTVTSTRSATHTAAMQSQVTGEYWQTFSITFDNIGSGPHVSLGGYVAGDNLMGSHEVRVNAGAVSWTQFTASASDTTGVSGLTSGTDESVSFTVPQGAAVRIAAEPIITVSWLETNIGDHIVTSYQHPPFLYMLAP